MVKVKRMSSKPINRCSNQLVGNLLDMGNFHVAFTVALPSKTMAAIITNVSLRAEILVNMCLQGVVDVFITIVTDVRFASFAARQKLVGFKLVRALELLGARIFADKEGLSDSMEGVLVTTKSALLKDSATVDTFHLHSKTLARRGQTKASE